MTMFQTAGTPRLKVDALVVSRGDLVTLRQVTFSLAKAEWLGIVGPSGSGKTILLEAFVNLSQVRGSIELDGQNILALATDARAQRGLCYLPTTGGVFDGFSVRENLRAIARRSSEEIESEILELCSDLPWLRDRWNVDARLLSGGERRLLSICRGSLMQPTVLMIDEPALGLSLPMIGTMKSLLARLSARHGTSIILTSGDKESLRECGVQRFNELRDGELLASSVDAEDLGL